MHLHIWNSQHRRSGLGLALVKMSLSHFFKTLKLQKIISEPFSKNASPNLTLQKAGFELVTEYVTTPGSINFEQPVKRWELALEKYESLGL